MASMIRSQLANYLQSLVKPSDYEWILPKYDRSKLDSLAINGQFPHVGGLADALFYAAMFGILRMLLTYFAMKPFAIASMKIKFKAQNRIPSVDTFIARSGPIAGIKSAEVAKFCKETADMNLSEAAVNAYIWSIRQDKSSNKKITKFVEALWRFLFYAYFCYLGYMALFASPGTVSWLKDTKEHWRDWPTQPISAAISFYYNIELGAYLHQLMWTEVSRSDSLEMILHHLVTILLIMFSFMTSFTRIGSSILLLHDSADIFLESAKIFNYISKTSGNAGMSIYCDTLFAIFALTFLVTRLILYPRYLVYSLVYESPVLLGGVWPGYWIFAGLLVVLQCLHVFWFYLILRMVYSLLSTGIEKDVRSDDEEEEGDDTKNTTTTATTPKHGEGKSDPAGGNKAAQGPVEKLVAAAKDVDDDDGRLLRSGKKNKAV